MVQLETLYTIKESYKYLKVSKSTIYKMIAKGLIKVTKFEGSTRIKESELKNLIS